MLNQQPYLDFVIKQAQKEGKVFFLDSGEGNDFLDPKTGWYIEDLSGWLIDPAEKENLIIARENGTADNDFLESYVFAKWSLADNGDLMIIFKKY